MKKNLLYLLSMIAVFASCSPAYKTTQTPDDVYYSPAKKIYVADRYDTYNSTGDDNYLRMKVRDHSRWNALDDYNYWYDSRYYGMNYYTPYNSYLSLGLGFGYSPFYSYNPYYYNSWNSWYSPAYTVVYYKNPTVYYKPVSRYNTSTYNNRNYNNTNMPLQNGRNNVYNNSNLRANRTNNNYYNNQNSNNNSAPARSYSNGGSSGGGGSRTSGGGSRTRP